MKTTLKDKGAELIGIGAIECIRFSEFGQVGHWGVLGMAKALASSCEGDTETRPLGQ